MAKKTGPATLTPDAEEVDEIEVVETPVVPTLPDPTTVVIELPVREMPDNCYRSRNIEVPGLTSKQADAAKALFEGLVAKSERLANGRYVRTLPDAIRWVLESIGAAK